MDVKKYYACGLDCLGSEPSQIRQSTQMVLGEDFDRVTAERDALQLRLNAVEEENDRLRSEVRGYVIQYHASIGNTEHHEDCQRDLAELEKRP